MALKFFKEDTFLLQGLALNSCLTQASERRDAPAALQSRAVSACSACGRKGAVCTSPNFSQLLGWARAKCLPLSWTVSQISSYPLPSAPSQIFYFPRLQPWEDHSLMHVCLFINGSFPCGFDFSSWLQNLCCVWRSQFSTSQQTYSLPLFLRVGNIPQQVSSFLRLTCGS